MFVFSKVLFGTSLRSDVNICNSKTFNYTNVVACRFGFQLVSFAKYLITLMTQRLCLHVPNMKTLRTWCYARLNNNSQFVFALYLQVA